jgi:hypothetical protein
MSTRLEPSRGAGGPGVAEASDRHDAIDTDIPARLDRLLWTRFHWLLVTALGVTWVLDGLEAIVVGAVGPMLMRRLRSACGPPARGGSPARPRRTCPSPAASSQVRGRIGLWDGDVLALQPADDALDADAFILLQGWLADNRLRPAPRVVQRDQLALPVEYRGTGRAHLRVGQVMDDAIVERRHLVPHEAEALPVAAGVLDDVRRRVLVRGHGPNEPLLKEIAQITGGTFRPTPESVFSGGGPPASRREPLWPYLLQAAALFFVADVALRRLRF